MKKAILFASIFTVCLNSQTVIKEYEDNGRHFILQKFEKFENFRQFLQEQESQKGPTDLTNINSLVSHNKEICDQDTFFVQTILGRTLGCINLAPRTIYYSLDLSKGAPAKGRGVVYRLISQK